MEPMSMSVSTDSQPLNLQAFNQQMQSTAKDSSLNLLMGNLTEAAAMAYGSGIGEGIKGGAGHIGVLNGKVVKFNTKLSERRTLNEGSGTYGEMMRACDNLRNRLASNLAVVERLLSGKASSFQAPDEQLSALKTKLSNLLGLKLEGGKLTEVLDNGVRKIGLDGSSRYQLSENRGLLTREAVAKSVTLIRDFLKDHVKKGEAAAEARAVLVRDDETGERADFDFHIWSKVKEMKGLSSQALSIDSFTYAKQAATALKQVARIKALSGGNGLFYKQLQKIGNEKMQEAISPIWLQGYATDFDKATLKMGGKLYEGIPKKKAQEMVRAFRLRSMAESMDAMYAKLLEHYNRGQPNNQPARAVSDLGETPFQRIFTRSFAKLRGKTEKEVAEMTPEQCRLSKNELRNLKAMMRNELQAFVVNQGNEFEPVQPGSSPQISVKVMLVKDLFTSCARLLDIDGELGDSSYVVGMDNGDRSGRHFRPDDAGKTVFGDGDYNIFTDETYAVSTDILAQVNLDVRIEQLKSTATKNVIAALFDQPHEVHIQGGDESVSLKLAPERFRNLATQYVATALKKLEKLDPHDDQTINSLRRDFIEKVLAFDAGINVDARKYQLSEDGPQEFTAPELMRKLVGDIFDQHLAAIQWPKDN